MLQPLCAERVLFSSIVNAEYRKLVTVAFPARGDGFYLFFSGFPPNPGVVIQSQFNIGDFTNKVIDLKVESKASSHLPKYNHPSDGMAHFSQDGKIYSQFIQSVPLSELDGHFFTVYLKGISDFIPAKPKDRRNNEKKKNIEIDLGSADPGWIQISGFWHRRKGVASRYRHGHSLRNSSYIVKDGQGNDRILIEPKRSDARSDYVLAIKFRLGVEFNKHEGCQLLFIGGFGKEMNSHCPTEAPSFLAMVFPPENQEELSQLLDTIDFKG